MVSPVHMIKALGTARDQKPYFKTAWRVAPRRLLYSLLGLLLFVKRIPGLLCCTIRLHFLLLCSCPTSCAFLICVPCASRAFCFLSLWCLVFLPCLGVSSSWASMLARSSASSAARAACFLCFSLD